LSSKHVPKSAASKMGEQSICRLVEQSEDQLPSLFFPSPFFKNLSWQIVSSEEPATGSLYNPSETLYVKFFVVVFAVC